MKKKIITLIVLLLIPTIINAESIKLNSSWRFAEFSKINSDSATLYKASNGNGHTVTVNAGHGTKGGTNVKTLSHPDSTGKVTGGTNAEGAVYSMAVSSGMDFTDGTSEATVTLQLAKKIKDKLLANGYNVVMIRESDDVQLDNIARTVIANNTSEIHLSVHFDSTNSDKGAFYMSVPDSLKYLDNVNSTWQQSEALGNSIINAFKENGLKIFENGTMDTDLTQTSYTEIPSIDFEYGDKKSDKSDKALEKYAEATVKGIANYFDEDYTPSSKNTNDNSNDNNDVDEIDIINYNFNDQEKAIVQHVMDNWKKPMQTDRIKLIDKALSFIGKGITYNDLDCSAYVAKVFNEAGFSIDATCTNEFATDSHFIEISQQELKPGDIALNAKTGGCTESGKSTNHVGIYLGNYDGKNIYLHSTSSGNSEYGATGPQIRTGEKNYKLFYRYQNFSSNTTTKTHNESRTIQIAHIKINWPSFIDKEIDCNSIFLKNGELNPLGEALNGLFTLMKIAAPVLTIALSTMEYIKAIASNNADDMKKTNKRTIKRIVVGLVLFFLPDLLNLLFKIFGLYGIDICTM